MLQKRAEREPRQVAEAKRKGKIIEEEEEEVQQQKSRIKSNRKCRPDAVVRVRAQSVINQRKKERKHTTRLN
jgi:hypothetical protein